jgi:hypothetical protein
MNSEMPTAKDMYTSEHLNRVETAQSVNISMEMFEKLYLSPENKVKGDLRKTFGNPTPLSETAPSFIERPKLTLNQATPWISYRLQSIGGRSHGLAGSWGWWRSYHRYLLFLRWYASNFWKHLRMVHWQYLYLCCVWVIW